MHVITLHVDEPVAVFDTPQFDVYARNELRERLADELRATIGGSEIGVDLLPVNDGS